MFLRSYRVPIWIQNKNNVKFKTCKTTAKLRVWYSFIDINAPQLLFSCLLHSKNRRHRAKSDITLWRQFVPQTNLKTNVANYLKIVNQNNDSRKAVKVLVWVQK